MDVDDGGSLEETKTTTKESKPDEVNLNVDSTTELVFKLQPSDRTIDDDYEGVKMSASAIKFSTTLNDMIEGTKSRLFRFCFCFVSFCVSFFHSRTDLGKGVAAKVNIPLATVDEKTLISIVKYCERLATEPPDEVKTGDVTDFTEGGGMKVTWKKKFISVDNATLFELILAANYLAVKDLLDLGCDRLASLIYGKTTEQIRTEFNIKNDFTEEEEKKLREENAWCEES